MIKLVFVGDIMPGGVLSEIDNNYISQDICEYLQQGNLRIGTLETAIGNNPTFYEEKMKRQADVIYAKDEDLKKLKDLHIDIVSLANNHFFDLGPNGAVHTIKLLDNLGIKHIGAGKNIFEAAKPVIETIEGKTIAFLGFCDWKEETVGWCPIATETTPGVNPMFDDYVVEEIKKNKLLYDYVVVMPHWGVEHTYNVTNSVFELAKIMIKAGADLIIGSHPHRVQPIVHHKNSIIAYSLGNFLFPDRLITSPRSTYYPDTTFTLSSFPITYDYPYVDRTTYKIWKPLARIGMIAITTIGSDKMSSEYRLVELNKENYLFLSEKQNSIKRHLNFNYFLLKYTPYKFSMLFIRVVNSLKYRVKKICHK